MCEMLVRVVDKHNDGDPAKTPRLRKRGDVVVVCEDGHPWTPKELANPEWQILKVPDMSVEEGRLLTAPPFVLKGLGSPSNRRSALRLDLDALGSSVTRATINAVTQLKPGVPEQSRPRMDHAERMGVVRGDR